MGYTLVIWPQVVSSVAPSTSLAILVATHDLDGMLAGDSGKRKTAKRDACWAICDGNHSRRGEENEKSRIRSQSEVNSFPHLYGDEWYYSRLAKLTGAECCYLGRDVRQRALSISR